MLDNHNSMPRDRLAFPRSVAPETAASDERPTVRARLVNGITIVEILDAETLFTAEAIADLTAQLRRLVEAGHTRIVLDFRAVRSVSSDVLGTLAGLHQRLEKLQGRLSLCGLDPVLRDMLRICRLDRVFAIDSDEDDTSHLAALEGDLARPRLQGPASSQYRTTEMGIGLGEGEAGAVKSWARHA